MTMESRAFDYSDTIQIADGIYWVGFADKT